MPKVNINIELLKKILSLHPQKVNDVYNTFDRISYWLDGRDKPTYIQLGQLARYLNIPFGYFFLNELPEQVFPIPHYRSVGSEYFEPSDELKDAVKIIRKRQEWIKEILIDYGNTALPFVGSVTVRDDIKETVNNMKEVLKIKNFKAKEFSNWHDTYHYLINQVENAGIFVVINGVVGNNTHRKLNVEEFRGFVLTDDLAPFVFINNSDAKSAQIFTLAHELAHIWLGKSASFDLRNMQATNNEIEQYCNKVAAEFLVPELELIKQFKNNKEFDKLAFHFKVSRIVIARRLLDLNIINKEDFFEYYHTIINREKTKSKDPGGDFYNNIPYRLSKKFGEIIYRAAKSGKISYRDAFRLTDLKAYTFDKYFEGYQK